MGRMLAGNPKVRKKERSATRRKQVNRSPEALASRHDPKRNLKGLPSIRQVTV
jgi:hypothetical protein